MTALIFMQFLGYESTMQKLGNNFDIWPGVKDVS
jgi:hypothetical protein